MRRALIVAFLLAGCLSAKPIPPGEAPDAAAVVPSGFQYVCPAGRTIVQNGICIGTLSAPDESIVEPFVALDRNRPQVVVLGVNVGRADRADITGAGAETIRFELRVSEDAGATWRSVALPRMPGAASATDVSSSIDPTLAFDADGRLHVSGMFRTGARLGWNIFYAATPDLGKTWSTPIILADDEDNDRSWITVAPGGRLFVPWGNPGGVSEVATSADGGNTWAKRTVPADRCEEVGPVLVHAGQPLVPCTLVNSGAPQTVVVHEMDNASSVVLSGVGEWPMLVETSDKELVLVAETSTQVFVLRNGDGQKWSRPTDLRTLTHLEDAWKTVEYQWVAADPWGALHVLLKGGQTCRTTTPGLIHCDDAELVHVALDPKDWRVLHEAKLKGPGYDAASRLPPSIAPSSNYEYDGLAFGADRGSPRGRAAEASTTPSSKP